MNDLPQRAVLALLVGASICAAPAHAEDPVVTGRTAGERSAEPREPAEFEYGQYHRSSKMTPEGSAGPERWGAERSDVGPPELGPEPDRRPSNATETSGGQGPDDERSERAAAGASAARGQADDEEEARRNRDEQAPSGREENRPADQ
jgi:hypothetical protein